MKMIPSGKEAPIANRNKQPVDLAFFPALLYLASSFLGLFR